MIKSSVYLWQWLKDVYCTYIATRGDWVFIFTAYEKRPPVQQQNEAPRHSNFLFSSSTALNFIYKRISAAIELLNKCPNICMQQTRCFDIYILKCRFIHLRHAVVSPHFSSTTKVAMPMASLQFAIPQEHSPDPCTDIRVPDRVLLCVHDR